MGYPYGNYYGYQPMQNQMPAYQPQQIPQTAPQPSGQNGMIWVSSYADVQQYLVAPNSAVTLWDTTAPVVYVKQADASGRPFVKIYDLVERSEAPTRQTENTGKFATAEEVSALAERVNALEQEAKHEPDL